MRSNVEIDDITATHRVCCLMGSEQIEEMTHCLDPRLSSLGLRFITHKDHNMEMKVSYQSVDSAEYKSWRVQHGVAEGQDEIPIDALPLEYNLDALNGISFSKGCYIGQELTARTHFQGVVRKRIMPGYLPGAVKHVHPGSDIRHQPEDKVVGQIRAVVEDYVLMILRIQAALDVKLGCRAIKVKYPDVTNDAASTENRTTENRINQTPVPSPVPVRSSEISSSQPSGPSERSDAVRRIPSNSSEDRMPISPVKHSKSHSSVSSVGTRLVGMLADKVVEDFIKTDSPSTTEHSSGKDRTVNRSSQSSIHKADILCNTTSSMYESQETNTSSKIASSSVLSQEHHGHYDGGNRSLTDAQDRSRMERTEVEEQRREDKSDRRQQEQKNSSDIGESSGVQLKSKDKRNASMIGGKLSSKTEEHLISSEDSSSGIKILDKDQQHGKMEGRLSPSRSTSRKTQSVSRSGQHTFKAQNKVLTTKQASGNSSRIRNDASDEDKKEQVNRARKSSTKSRLSEQEAKFAAENRHPVRLSNSETTGAPHQREFASAQGTEPLSRSLEHPMEDTSRHSSGQYVVRRVFHASSLAEVETESSDGSVLSLEVSSVGQDALDSGDLTDRQVLGRLRKAKSTKTGDRSTTTTNTSSATISTSTLEKTTILFERSKELLDKRTNEKSINSEIETLPELAFSNNRTNEMHKQQSTVSHSSSSLTIGEDEHSSRP
eukprot:g3524.t1